MSYNGTQDLFGIELYQYNLNASQLLNATLNPENAAYYSFDMPSGLLNLTSVSQGNCVIQILSKTFLILIP